MFVIGVRDKPLKMDEKVDGFSAAIGLNNEYRKNFKGGVPQLIGVERGLSPLAAHKNCGLSDPTNMLC